MCSSADLVDVGRRREPEMISRQPLFCFVLKGSKRSLMFQEVISRESQMQPRSCSAKCEQTEEKVLHSDTETGWHGTGEKTQGEEEPNDRQLVPKQGTATVPVPRHIRSTPSSPCFLLKGTIPTHSSEVTRMSSFRKCKCGCRHFPPSPYRHRGQDAQATSLNSL